MAVSLTRRVEQRVAVIDDSPAVRQSLRLLLRNRGYAVDVFAGSAEMLVALEEDVFDLYVIDLKLDGLDGVALLAELRQKGIEAPAILISGWEGSAVDRQAAQAGFAAFVRKPMLETSIVDEVRRILGPAY